jgi:hypothetical protein
LRGSAALAVAVLTLAAHASAQRPAPRRAPPPPPARPAPPLPALPSVARVRLDVAPDHVVAVQEILLPRGDWESGDLDLYVAFGAPGTPIAFDVHLLAVADGALEPEAQDIGEPVAFERAPRCPVSAQVLLGRAQMAGAILHVREPAFRRAIAPGNMAALRLRTLLPLPDEDAQTGRELKIRLGAARGTPLTLGRLQLVASAPFVTRAEARLCGPDADPYPLAIAATPRVPPPQPPPIAPVLAVRHATDDLCVRVWTTR